MQVSHIRQSTMGGPSKPLSSPTVAAAPSQRRSDDFEAGHLAISAFRHPSHSIDPKAVARFFELFWRLPESAAPTLKLVYPDGHSREILDADLDEGLLTVRLSYKQGDEKPPVTFNLETDPIELEVRWSDNPGSFEAFCKLADDACQLAELVDDRQLERNALAHSKWLRQWFKSPSPRAVSPAAAKAPRVELNAGWAFAVLELRTTAGVSHGHRI